MSSGASLRSSCTKGIAAPDFLVGIARPISRPRHGLLSHAGLQGFPHLRFQQVLQRLPDGRLEQTHYLLIRPLIRPSSDLLRFAFL